MHLKYLFGAIIVLSMLGCGGEAKTTSTVPALADSAVAYHTCDTSGMDTMSVLPVMGYRFTLRGDFDGDGQPETLTEHYTDSTGKETNKFYVGLSDYGAFVDSTVAKGPVSYLSCDNSSIDTFFVAAMGQVLGLSMLRNEGDLNGDGTDEISYVGNWADWSSLNSCKICTYRHGRWEVLYEIEIWDWQIPDLPETYSDYGLFGMSNVEVHIGYDSINQVMEKELLAFPGFIVKKMGNGHIQVRYRTMDAEEDTMEVNLNGL